MAAAAGATIAVAAGSYAEDVVIQGKSVRLFGRCPALVEVTGAGVELAAIQVFDQAPDGTAIWFRDYFDTRGGVGAFGFPREEPTLRDGAWTQRFQAAIFEYHPENDVDGPAPGTDIPLRNWRVQLALLGDSYIDRWQLPYR